MRVVKVSADSFANMVRAEGKFSKFVRIPSSNAKYVFQGLLAHNGVWVAWPDNLTDREAALYQEMYGDVPDIINDLSKEDKAIWTQNSPKVGKDGENEDKPS